MCVYTSLTKSNVTVNIGKSHLDARRYVRDLVCAPRRYHYCVAYRLLH